MAADRLPVLIAEDSPVIRTVLREMLARWGYEVSLAVDGADAWERLRELTGPRLAIFDWMMPRMTGPELCRRVRKHLHEPHPYILMLTSRAEAGDIGEGLNAGADDYLTKPFHAQELWARVRAGARIVRMQEQLLAAGEELRRRASFDDLTTLLNRPAILQALDAALGDADREGQPLSILLVDIDRFRQINNTFGLPAGDLVLRECGRRIRDTVPSGASPGRCSGEEFLVVLPAVAHPEAARIGERIRDAIASGVFDAGAASFPVTCTVGVACRDGHADGTMLLRAADDALRAARTEARERAAARSAVPA